MADPDDPAAQSGLADDGGLEPVPPPAAPPGEDLGPPRARIQVPIEAAPYNPDRDREQTRSKLATRVLWLLVGAVLLISAPIVTGFRTWDEMEGLASSILPATLSVVGSVLGFYYGAERGRS